MTRRIDIICPTCGKALKSRAMRRHLIDEHGQTEIDYILLADKFNKKKKFENVPFDVAAGYLRRIQSRCESVTRENIHNSQFSTFYKIVTHCRKFSDSDYDTFFDSVLPWQLEHPKTVNSRQLCRLCHHDSDEFANKVYHELMEVKNPYYNHGGKFSPFSKHFVGYEGLTDEQKVESAENRARENNDQIVHTTSLQYWLNKGYSEEEAKVKLRERQTTFTLEKCIERHGEEEGRRIYEDRQRRWIRSLNNRSKSELFEMNKSKCPHIPPVNGFSYESQALFWEIECKRGHREFESRFALNGEGENNEFVFERDNGRCFYLDYCIPELKCLIEYDGLHWHNESKDYDEERRAEIAASGYQIMVVTDEEYKDDRSATVSKCLSFIERCANDGSD